MLAPLQAEKTECVWYELDSRLAVSAEVQIEQDDLLVYVNYFGLHNKNVCSLLKRFPPNQILLDFSQSFFQPPVGAALATIYSPRKFFGVPDGGLLAGSLPHVDGLERDMNSLGRSVHLLERLAGSPEDGYASYLRAEKSLEDCEPKVMSQLTEHILRTVDYEGVRKARHDNFMLLHHELGGINDFNVDIAEAEAPLCYPFMADSSGLRECLIANRVFVPTYWADALHRTNDGWTEHMVRNLLPLPVDQRYGHADMERIVAVIKENLL